MLTDAVIGMINRHPELVGAGKMEALASIITEQLTARGSKLGQSSALRSSKSEAWAGEFLCGMFTSSEALNFQAKNIPAHSRI